MSSGDVFFPTDGYVIERSNGSNWKQWGPIWPLTKMDPTAFSWVNQDTANYTDAGGAVSLYAPSGAYSINMLMKSMASTPCTYTMAFIPNVSAVNYLSVGLALRQSSDGKIIYFGYASYTDQLLNKATDATHYSAAYFSTTSLTYYGPMLWFRVTDDGTNRIHYWSNDGKNYLQAYSVGRTDFMTADQVGIFILPQGSAGYTPRMTVFSWEET